MSVEQLRPFPSHFRLKDLCAISAPFFEYKLNPHEQEAARATYAWFDRYVATVATIVTPTSWASFGLGAMYITGSRRRSSFHIGSIRMPG